MHMHLHACACALTDGAAGGMRQAAYPHPQLLGTSDLTLAMLLPSACRLPMHAVCMMTTRMTSSCSCSISPPGRWHQNAHAASLAGLIWFSWLGMGWQGVTRSYWFIQSCVDEHCEGADLETHTRCRGNYAGHGSLPEFELTPHELLNNMMDCDESWYSGQVPLFVTWILRISVTSVLRPLIELLWYPSWKKFDYENTICWGRGDPSTGTYINFHTCDPSQYVRSTDILEVLRMAVCTYGRWRRHRTIGRLFRQAGWLCFVTAVQMMILTGGTPGIGSAGAT